MFQSSSVPVIQCSTILCYIPQPDTYSSTWSRVPVLQSWYSAPFLNLYSSTCSSRLLQPDYTLTRLYYYYFIFPKVTRTPGLLLFWQTLITTPTLHSGGSPSNDTVCGLSITGIAIAVGTGTINRIRRVRDPAFTTKWAVVRKSGTGNFFFSYKMKKVRPIYYRSTHNWYITSLRYSELWPHCKLQSGAFAWNGDETTWNWK